MTASGMSCTKRNGMPKDPRHLRDHLGLTQQQLAEELGVRQQAIERMGGGCVRATPLERSKS